MFNAYSFRKQLTAMIHRWAMFAGVTITAVFAAMLLYAQSENGGLINPDTVSENIILTRVPATSISELHFFHKNPEGIPYEKVYNLKPQLEAKGQELKFATNGGIFMENLTPLGLLIENGEQIAKLNTIKKAYGNFYLQPNGVLKITKSGIAQIVTTDNYQEDPETLYALQSGPMLVINDEINPIMDPLSESRKVRNGVGLLPSGELIFAKSLGTTNFYDFAQAFQTIGATQALYLDGSISMHYDPSQNQNYQYGKYSVIIGWVTPLLRENLQ